MSSGSITYRIISLSLAFLMFSTSVGFAVDMHYCQGKLKSVSFFGKAKTCHDMTDVTQMNNCPHHKKVMKQIENCSKEDKKDCCDNKTVHIHSDQDQAIQTLDFTNKQIPQFVIAYVVAFFNINLINSNIPSFSIYKPPIVPKDIPVLIQSFLL